MRPAWFRLLELNNQRSRFGLTVPFLVGACLERSEQALEPDVVRNCLASLLQSMRDETPSSHVIRISECDRLHQPVAAPIPGMITSGIGIPIPPAIGTPARLYIEQQYLVGPPTIESASQGLWQLLGTCLSAGQFSFRGGSYHAFDNEDRALLTSAATVKEEDEG